MSTEHGAYRWWENYLVRYLMPSIAGAVIVSWLVDLGGAGLRKLLLLEIGDQGLQAPTLVLLFLYGNLFCYVASYPILGFHVTRAIDFKAGQWRHTVWDGYISTGLLAIAVLLLTTVQSSGSGFWRAAPFFLVSIFAGLQLLRIYLALARVTVEGLSEPSSEVFSYSYALAKRRGLAEELRITKQVTQDAEDEDTGERFNEESERHRRSIWRREFIDSYRHMREHGNSAFIFLLELTLAGLIAILFRSYQQDGEHVVLSALGVLLALWALPAVFVHFIGQHVERRFSWYDRKRQAAASRRDEP